MKIRTNYTKNPVDYEAVVEDRITDGSQYVTISEAIQAVARGETLDLHDYTQDNPLDRSDFMDVADRAEAIQRAGEEAKQRLTPKPPTETPPTEIPPTKIDPTEIPPTE